VSQPWTGRGRVWEGRGKVHETHKEAKASGRRTLGQKRGETRRRRKGLKRRQTFTAYDKNRVSGKKDGIIRKEGVFSIINRIDLDTGAPVRHDIIKTAATWKMTKRPHPIRLGGRGGTSDRRGRVSSPERSRILFSVSVGFD